MLRKLKVDSTTRYRLGRAVLDDVRTRLLAVDCQTCGRPLARDTPSLVVHFDGELAGAALHHRSCHAPRWFDSPASATSGAPTLTWRAATFLLEPRGMPIFLVNPSCEAVVLRWTGAGWRPAELDAYVSAGLSDYTDHATRPEVVEEMTATLDANRLRVGFTIGDKNFSWASGAGPAVMAAVDERASLIVGVTQLLDPATAVTPDQVLSLMTSGRLACGIAEVGFGQTVQALNAEDFHQDVRAERFGVCGDALKRTLGIELEGHIRLAAFAACGGNPAPLNELTCRDRCIGLLLVAALYANSSGDRSVHVLLPDDADAIRVHSMFKAVFAELGVGVGRLPDYRADVVLGSPEQFAAARARNPQRRNRLAILLNAGEVPPEQLTSYRRVLRTGRPPVEKIVSGPDVHGQDVQEQLMRQRVVFLGADIDDDTANRLTAQLLLLADQDPRTDITLYINSKGGSVTAAMAVLDTMNLVEPDVATYAMGLAAGSAQLLLTAGTPGKRHALTNARVLLRQPTGPTDPDPLERELAARWTREITELIADAAGQPVDQVRQDLERERWFTAAEAREYGLVDRVVDRPS